MEQQVRPKGRMGRAYFFTGRPDEIEVAKLEGELPDRDRKTVVDRRDGMWCVEVTWDPE